MVLFLPLIPAEDYSAAGRATCADSSRCVTEGKEQHRPAHQTQASVQNTNTRTSLAACSRGFPWSPARDWSMRGLYCSLHTPWVLSGSGLKSLLCASQASISYSINQHGKEIWHYSLGGFYIVCEKPDLIKIINGDDVL